VLALNLPAVALFAWAARDIRQDLERASNSLARPG
jgi:hypothetical protein